MTYRPAFKQKRRLRKKLFKGEFTVYHLIFEFTPKTSDSEHLADDLIKFLKSRNLGVCGFFGEPAWGVVSTSERYKSVTETDKIAIVSWLNAREDVTKLVAWLSDAYN